MNKTLHDILRVMTQTHGRDLSPYDELFLTRSIEQRLAATGLSTAVAYTAYLAENAVEAQRLEDALNIAFSQFFRNPLAFALLEQLVLPGIIARHEESGGAEIRVWSAGCAGGQEAYSLAILLDELIALRKSPVTFRIFATDISALLIAFARAGLYDADTLQNVRLRHLRKYFSQEEDNYRIDPQLRTHVEFGVYDLLNALTNCPPASIYGEFDLVLCSNLLYYYRPDIRRGILTKLYRALSDEGHLVTSEAERAIVDLSRGFRSVARPAAVFRKVRHGQEESYEII